MEKEKENRSKRVKQVKKREELRHIGGTIGIKKQIVTRGKGGGVNIVFGPKYRPCHNQVQTQHGLDIF
jgi:hypothetical protein